MDSTWRIFYGFVIILLLWQILELLYVVWKNKKIVLYQKDISPLKNEFALTGVFALIYKLYLIYTFLIGIYVLYSLYIDLYRYGIVAHLYLIGGIYLLINGYSGLKYRIIEHAIYRFIGIPAIIIGIFYMIIGLLSLMFSIYTL